MLHEVTKCFIPYSKHEDTFTSWDKDVLAVRMEKGIQFYELTYNLQCMDKNIDNISHILPSPKSSPLTSFIPHELLKSGINNIELTQMMIDPDFWSFIPELVEEMANVVSFKFSPKCVTYNNEVALAVLNNMGGVEVFSPGRHRWKGLLNFSEVMKTSLPGLKQPNNLEQLKQVAGRLDTTAICWGPITNNHSCIFVTAQKNGSVIFWLLTSQETSMKAEFFGEVQTEAGEIIETHWLAKTDLEFMIICTNSFGQIFALNCYIDENSCKLRQITYIWSNKDNMITKYMQYTMVDRYFALVFNKHRHLLAMLVDANGTVQAEVLRNVNDHKITCISSTKNSIYLSTVNCKVYKLQLSGTVDGFDVHPLPIPLKESYTNHDLHGISLSRNGVLMAGVLMDRKVKHKKEPLQITMVLLADPEISESKLLLENSTKKLTDYWDCIELLRYRTLRTKKLPPLDYKELYKETETDLYKLKLYYIFASLYNVLDKLTKNGSKDELPETSLELLRDKLFFHQAVHVLNSLYADFKVSGRTPNDFQLETYLGAKRYLHYYCNKYDKDINKLIEPKMLCLVKNGDITCQCCDENLIGFSCSQGHVNMFCSLTFTLIESFDYLICKCGCTARIELYQTEPMCLFCDLYLNRFSQTPLMQRNEN